MLVLEDLASRNGWGNSVAISEELRAMQDDHYYNTFYRLPDKWSRIPCDAQENARMLTVQNMARLIFEQPSRRGNTNYQILNFEKNGTIKVGEVAFVLARYPNIFTTYTPHFPATINSIAESIRSFVPLGEALAWTFVFDDKVQWNKIPQITDALIAEGVGFDDAQPYISQGVLDSEQLIGYIKHDIDPSLVRATAGAL